MSKLIPKLAFAPAGPKHSRWHAPSSAVALLQRYPHLSEHELPELINLVRRMRVPELALIMADNKMGPRLEAFCDQHQPWAGERGRIRLVLFAVALIGMVLLAWPAVFA
jgi:hypothetical protein